MTIRNISGVVMMIMMMMMVFSFRMKSEVKRVMLSFFTTGTMISSQSCSDGSNDDDDIGGD